MAAAVKAEQERIKTELLFEFSKWTNTNNKLTFIFKQIGGMFSGFPSRQVNHENPFRPVRSSPLVAGSPDMGLD